MDKEVFILEILKEIKESQSNTSEDIAMIRGDLQYHIQRTDLNEHRIIELEERHIKQDEKKLNYIKIGFAVIASLLSIGMTLKGLGIL